MFADDSFAAPAPQPRRSLGDSARETLRQFRAGKSAGEIATARGIVTGTVMGHLAEGIELGEPVELSRFFSGDEQKKIAAAFDRNGFGNLTGTFESLGGTIDYGRLRIFRAAMNASSRNAAIPHTPPQQ
jgi:uncharacterized protein YpbB